MIISLFSCIALVGWKAVKQTLDCDGKTVNSYLDSANCGGSVEISSLQINNGVAVRPAMFSAPFRAPVSIRGRCCFRDSWLQRTTWWICLGGLCPKNSECLPAALKDGIQRLWMVSFITGGRAIEVVYACHIAKRNATIGYGVFALVVWQADKRPWIVSRVSEGDSS